MPKINENIDRIPFYLTKKISEETESELGIINLSRGQAGFQPPLEIYKEAKRIIDPKDKTLFKYEKLVGSKDLRRAISNWYGKIFNLDLNPKNIVVTDGGTGGISLSLQFLTNQGDEIIIPDPAYPYYIVSAKYGLENRVIKRLPIGKEKVNREKLGSVIGENTQVIILTSPHNPTGVVYDFKTLEGIMELAKEKDFFVLYDENHFPEIYDGKKHLPLTLFDKERKHSIVLGSLSRLGLQGERIGWAVLPEDLSERFSITYSTHNLSVNTPAQRLGTFVLDNYENLDFDKLFKEYEEKRNWLIPEINKFDGFDCHIPEGTCYAFPNIKEFVDKNRKKLEKIVKTESKKRRRSDDDIKFSLEHNSVLAYKFLLYTTKVGGLPGLTYGPESDDYIRLSFSVGREDIEEAVNRMKNMDKFL